MAAADASSDQSVPSLKLKPRGDGGGGGEDSKIIAAESISSSREKKPWGPSRVSLRSRSSSSDASLSLLVQEEDAGDQQSSRNLWQVYALGAFLVGRWAWSRWRERRAAGEDSED